MTPVRIPVSIYEGFCRFRILLFSLYVKLVVSLRVIISFIDSNNCFRANAELLTVVRVCMFGQPLSKLSIYIYFKP